METRKKAAAEEKRTRQIKKNYNLGRKKPVTLYDDEGYLKGEDLCDCLNKTCTGCHFPCPNCSSQKCGHECRCNRKYQYASIHTEGRRQV